MYNLCVATVSFFDEKLNLDVSSNTKLFKDLFEKRVSSIVISGTTGEGPTLTREEKLFLLNLAIEARDVVLGDNSNYRPEIFLNVGTNNTIETLDFIREINELPFESRPDAIMVVNPYYNKPNQLGIYKHFEVINQASDFPIMVYHIPGRTSSTIELDTLKKIVSLKNIKYVKDSTSDLKTISLLIDYINNKDLDVEVYSGDDSNILPYLSIGAKGVVSVAGNIIPEEIISMMNSFQSCDLDESAKAQAKLNKFCNKLFPEFAPNPLPIKYLLSESGLGLDIVRPPLATLTKTEKTTIKNIL